MTTIARPNEIYFEEGFFRAVPDLLLRSSIARFDFISLRDTSIFAQRACEALRAEAMRSSAVMFFARAFPPRFPSLA